jgi:cytochrome c biogenesis protein CcdA
MGFFVLALGIAFLGCGIMVGMTVNKEEFERHWIVVVSISTIALLLMLFLGRTLYTKDIEKELCSCFELERTTNINELKGEKE